MEKDGIKIWDGNGERMSKWMVAWFGGKTEMGTFGEEVTGGGGGGGGDRDWKVKEFEEFERERECVRDCVRFGERNN